MAKKLLKHKKNEQILSFIKKRKNVFLALIFLFILIDIFYFPKSSDVRIFSILGLSILGIYVYKLSSKVVFALCIILLLLMGVDFIATKASITTEKTAVWFFLFFGLGIIRQWKE